MRSFLVVSTFIAFVATTFLGTLHFTSWEDIPTGLGGTEVALDESGNRCWYFALNAELICFEGFETWYGRDAVPLYVMDDKGYTPIERSRKY